MKELKDYSFETVKQKLDELSKIHCEEIKKICLELIQALSKDKKDPKYLGIPNINFSLIAPGDDREKDFSKQRLERGFDSSELWSLRDTIADFILPRLKAFAKDPCGYPGFFNHEKEWIEVLNKMIKAFEISKKDTDGYEIVTDDEWKDWEKGMSLFHEHFLNLWT